MLELKSLDYAVILITEEECNKIQDTIARVVGIAEAEAMVESIVGPLIVILVGVPLPTQGTDKIRRSIVERIRAEVGPKVSIVHGAATCPVGIVGTQTRKAYTAFIPGYQGILKDLASMRAGTIEERNA